MAPTPKGTRLRRTKDGVEFTLESYKNSSNGTGRIAVLRNAANNRKIEKPATKLKAEFEKIG